MDTPIPKKRSRHKKSRLDRNDVWGPPKPSIELEAAAARGVVQATIEAEIASLLDDMIKRILRKTPLAPNLLVCQASAK